MRVQPQRSHRSPKEDEFLYRSAAEYLTPPRIARGGKKSGRQQRHFILSESLAALTAQPDSSSAGTFQRLFSLTRRAAQSQLVAAMPA